LNTPETTPPSIPTNLATPRANDSSGSQFRSGTTIDDNLWLLNPYPHNIGAPTAGGSTVTNNVYMEAVSNVSASGWGPGTMESNYEGDSYHVGVITFANAHAHNSNSGISINDSGFVGDVISNNIVCDWNLPIDDAGTATVISGNQTKASDCNAGGWTGSQPNLVDPNRTVGGYYASIGNPGGFPSTTAGFLAAARLQSKKVTGTRL
jgi:hypothetical protein